MAIQPPIGMIGGGITDATLQRQGDNSQAFQDREKAMAFQSHLDKGYAGMVEFMNELPEEVKGRLPNPETYSDSDEKRSMFYMEATSLMNRHNMQAAGQAGNTAEVERLALNDKSATVKDFTNFSENQKLDAFSKDFEPTKKKTSVVNTVSGIRDIIKSQESGGRYDLVHKQPNDSTPESGIAHGAYGITPKYWFKKIGLDPDSAEDRQTFLKSPDIQDKAFEAVLDDMSTRFDGNIDKVLAEYYGGAGKNFVLGDPTWDKEQKTADGTKMPTINEYVRQVKAKMAEAGVDGETSTKIIEEEVNKDKSDVAMEAFKEDPRLLDKIEPLLKNLGVSGESLAALRAKAAAERNRILDDKNKIARARFDHKIGQDEKEEFTKYAKNTEDSESLKTDFAVLESKLGGFESDGPVPGFGVMNRPFRKYLATMSDDSAEIRNMVEQIFGTLGHKISGANFTEPEMARAEARMGMDLFSSEKVFRKAMRHLQVKNNAEIERYRLGLDESARARIEAMEASKILVKNKGAATKKSAEEIEADKIIADWLGGTNNGNVN